MRFLPPRSTVLITCLPGGGAGTPSVNGGLGGATNGAKAAAALHKKRAARAKTAGGTEKKKVAAEPPEEWDGGPIFFVWKTLAPLGKKLAFLLPAPEKATNPSDPAAAALRGQSRKSFKANESAETKRKREEEGGGIGGGICQSENAPTLCRTSYKLFLSLLKPDVLPCVHNTAKSKIWFWLLQ